MKNSDLQNIVFSWAIHFLNYCKALQPQIQYVAKQINKVLCILYSSQSISLTVGKQIFLVELTGYKACGVHEIR